MLKVIALMGVFLATMMGVTVPVTLAEAEETKRSSLGGRWNVVLNMPRDSYELPVEFVVAVSGKVTVTVLGPLGTFRINDTKARLDGNKLTIGAETSYGKLTIDATLEGDRLHGKWFHEGLVERLFFNGEVRGLRDRSYVAKPPLEVFDAIWSYLERDFYRPDFNGVDVRSLRSRYRPQAAAGRNDGDFLALVRRMLGEFRTSHLEFFAAPSWSKELHPVRVTNSDTSAGITWRQLAPSVGYLRIESFEDGPKVGGRIDRAFAELGDYAALVVDLRGNGGGALSTAMRLGDHLLPRMQAVGYFASRAGLTRHRARSIDQINPKALPVFSGYDSADLAREMTNKGALMLATGGRAERPYRGRAVVLIDEYCFSASEALASVVKETHAATLIGRRTAGAMLAANPVSLEGGWTLLLPVWDFRTPQGVGVEGRGVEPTIAVKYRDDKDADIAAALAFLSQ